MITLISKLGTNIAYADFSKNLKGKPKSTLIKVGENLIQESTLNSLRNIPLFKMHEDNGFFEIKKESKKSEESKEEGEE